MKPDWGKLDGLRKALLPIVLLLTAAWLASFTGRLMPMDKRLLLPYAGLALATVAWMLSCLGIGHAALRLLPPLDIPFGERLVFDFSVGVLLFAEGLFVLGLAGLLRPPFFFLYPAALLIISAPACASDFVRAWQAGAVRRPWGRPSLLYDAAIAFGALGIVIVYLTIMVPDNTAFDARTYHLPIAEHYAAWGRIGKLPEGWYAGVLPHFASWLYTWPFTLQSASLFTRVELAAHMEFALFLATVFFTPLLVEAICPGRDVRGTWTIFFLFPGLFLYDSSLGLAADHVLAFWAVPLALALRRMLEQPSSPARAALTGLMMAGAALTKYQAVYLLAPAGLVALSVPARLVWQWQKAPRAARPSIGSTLKAPGALVLSGLVATASHWLANIVWHGNPVYPLLLKVFPSHPRVPGWPGPGIDDGWSPVGTPLAKLRETAEATFTFSFVPHDWPTFHRDLPVFGFLFTLTLPVLLLVRGQWRARLLALGTLLGVFIWYWTFHQDRYLQALLPWMVASTAAALLLAWEAGTAARLGVASLVAVQLAWSGDIPWLPTHAMMGDVPAMRALRVLSSSFRGDFESRWQFDTGFHDLDQILPKDAYVLLHEEYLKLGLGRRAIADSLRWQGAIDYRQLARPDRVHDRLVSLGATHVVWSRSRSWNREVPVAGELVFFGYAMRYTEEQRDSGGYVVARLPLRPPPPREAGSVAYLGCHGVYALRLDEVDGVVGNDGHAPGPNADRDATLATAEFAVTDGRCQKDIPPNLSGPFLQAPAWGDLTLWVRRN